MFRGGYASDRLTCDGTDVQTTRQEMGHSSLALLDKEPAQSVAFPPGFGTTSGTTRFPANLAKTSPRLLRAGGAMT